jgi:replication factor A2
MSDKAGYYESPSKTFSPGSQDGSNKKRNQPLLPVSIRQLHNAQQVTPDADDFTLNNQPLTTLCLIGQIVASQPTTTHLNYTVDDSTGTIDVRSWVDQDNPQKNQAVLWGAGDYVRVIGNLRSFGEKRYVVAQAQLLPIEDFNEVTHHFLEIIHLNLTLSGRSARGSSNSGMDTSSSYYKTPVDTNNNNNNNNNSLNDLQDRIIRIVQQHNQNGEGVGIDVLVDNFAQLYDEDSVRRQIIFLIDEGHLYNTTDANHVGATDEC